MTGIIGWTLGEISHCDTSPTANTSDVYSQVTINALLSGSNHLCDSFFEESDVHGIISYQF